ncbi:MAG: hypothetical protein UW22_C0080G0004 [Candidatus Gottesmanbacteria bacterium GW2011_GWB1_44_11c]|nr:MAG: hypothetical protein UW22_C0080G0004 [Candidatus Gottesmanbacteria bacterium GW2011_GWB1_44_11c]HCM81940.1 hypothetical protein [Patescibacteria group bacterium]
MEAMLLAVSGLLVFCLAFFAASKKAGGVAIVLLLIAGGFFAAAYFGFADLSHQQTLEKLAEQKQQVELQLLQAQVRDTNAGAALKEEAFTWLQGARWGIAIKTLMEFAPCLVGITFIFVILGFIVWFFLRSRQYEDEN